MRRQQRRDRRLTLGGFDMAELMQPNIVGNFLNAYQSGLERQEAQKEAERQRMRQDRADQMSEQRFGMEMDANTLDMAIRRTQALNELLAQVPDGDEMAFQSGVQRASLPVEQGGLGIPREMTSHLTVKDLPRLKMQTGQTMRELELKFKQAQIGTEEEQGRAARALATQRYAAASGGGAGGGATGKPPSGYRWSETKPGELESIPGGPADAKTGGAVGKPLSAKLENDLASLGQKLTDVRGFASTFDDAFAARGVMGMGGDARNWFDRNLGSGSAAANWWQSYDRYKNVVRNELFGAALTAGETANFEKSDINPSMNAATIRANLKRQQDVLEQAAARRSASLKVQGYNKQAIDLLSGAAPTAPAPSGPPAAGKTKRGVSYTVLGD